MTENRKSSRPEDSAWTIHKESIQNLSAPSALRKEILMKQNFKSRKSSRTKKMLFTSLAAAGLLFAGADSAVYAATGSSVLHHIMMTINGTSRPVQFEKVTEDGETYFTGRFEDGENSVQIAVEDEDMLKDLHSSGKKDDPASGDEAESIISESETVYSGEY